MSWNYRIIRYDTLDGFVYAVCSAYYDSMGVMDGHSVRGAEITGETLEELRSCFEKFKRAFEEPIVHFDPNEGYKEIDEQMG